MLKVCQLQSNRAILLGQTHVFTKTKLCLFYAGNVKLKQPSSVIARNWWQKSEVPHKSFYDGGRPQDDFDSQVLLVL